MPYMVRKTSLHISNRLTIGTGGILMLVVATTGRFNDLLVLDIPTMTWVDLSTAATGPVPAARALHGFVNIGERFFVHGGIALNLGGRLQITVTLTPNGACLAARICKGVGRRLDPCC